MKKLFAILLVIFVISGPLWAATVHKPRVQKATVRITDKGYQPSSFRLKRSIPADITFIRTSKYDCGEVVVFPTYGIRRDLPLNVPVTIRITPRRTGSFTFTCGMDMMRGQVFVDQ